jgi:hypothetical protein
LHHKAPFPSLKIVNPAIQKVSLQTGTTLIDHRESQKRDDLR